MLEALKGLFAKINHFAAGQGSLELPVGLTELPQPVISRHKGGHTCYCKFSKKGVVRAQSGRGIQRHSTDWALCTGVHNSRHRRRYNSAAIKALRDYSRTNRCYVERLLERLRATNEDTKIQMHASLTAAVDPTYEEIWTAAWRAIRPPKTNEERCA